MLLEIPLEKELKIPLYLQISGHLEKMISSGSLQEGFKLPSSRELALSLAVSRTTVIEAYRHLEDGGFVRQKGRSGAYVCRKMHDGRYDKEDNRMKWDMASGIPSSELMPFSCLAKLSKEILHEGNERVLELAPPEGVPELRQELLSHAVSRGIPARWENVFVTSGGREGLAVSMAALKASGVSRLWLEELTYPDAAMIARSFGFNLGVLPLDLGIMTEIIGGLGPEDAVYLVPSFQNPTGRTIPSEARRIILDRSMSRGIWIIEDDAYGELRYGEITVPALKSMDGSERVIYLGSFSQALFPGLRLGYSLLPESMRRYWKECQIKGSGPVSSLVQFLITRFIKSGGLDEALSIARSTIASRMAALARGVAKHLVGTSFSVPEGGIYLWLETPGLDGDRAEKLAREGRIAIASGNGFSWMHKKVEAVRLSVSSVATDDMEKAILVLRNRWNRK